MLTEQAKAEAAKDPTNEAWVPNTDLIQTQRTLLLNALAVLQDARADQEQDINDKRQRLLTMPEVKLSPAQVEFSSMW